MEEKSCPLSDSPGGDVFEVEMKFSVNDQESLAARLRPFGAMFGEPVRQSDCYFQHPCRDFAATDEALRIRRKSEAAYVTYKGPRLEGSAKSRREVEFLLENEAAFKLLLEVLGFQPVAVVEKRRRTASVVVSGREVEFALDEVESVGSYVEIETLASAEELPAAQECIGEIAEQLGLANPEHRSYLGLLLQRMGRD